MWADTETDRDFINFESVADSVAEIIAQSGQAPISIGVSGAWGVGKSSMIKLIRRSLAGRPGQQKQFVFVDFNAWLYQGYDDARAALVETIAATLAKEVESNKTGVEKATDLLRRVNWLRAAKLTGPSALALALGLPPVGLVGAVAEMGAGILNRGGPTPTDLDRVGDIAAQAGGAADGLLKPRASLSPPREIGAIRETFDQLLRTAGVNLVVLIDDLDRCLPETMIATLEAIRLFLFLPNTAFVIAADDAMIKHAVRKHFDGIEDQNLITSYFDKLIQIPIRVPPLGTQEVRAYMDLLYVDASDLPLPTKDEIRKKVCAQLRESWKGARVDRAFMQSTSAAIPTELIDRFDTADRLAPLMTRASQIAGNPRLIKRFLNALAIRMAVAKRHGVGLDEAVLAKVMLFERCATTQAFGELAAAVANSPDGKWPALATWESDVSSGKAATLPDTWSDPFVTEWLGIQPRIGDLDLRSAMYVSREHAPIVTQQDRLSPLGAELLTAVLAKPAMAGSVKTKLSGLAKQELSIFMDRLLELARREQTWGTPDVLTAALEISSIDAAQGERLASFLRDRPPAQITPALVPRIGGQTWAKSVYNEWKKAGVTTQVRKAIGVLEDS